MFKLNTTLNNKKTKNKKQNTLYFQGITVYLICYS